jgi:hypothetical protein
MLMPKSRVVVWLGVAVSIITALAPVADATAQTTQSSPNLRFEEAVLGTGGLIESSSNNFKVRETIGDADGGDSST